MSRVIAVCLFLAAALCAGAAEVADLPDWAAPIPPAVEPVAEIPAKVTAHLSVIEIYRAAGLRLPPQPVAWSPAWIRIRRAEETGDPAALVEAYLFYARSVERAAIYRARREARNE